MSILDFTSSEALTLGVELELQLIDRRDGNLTRAASDFGDSQINGQPSALKPGDDVFQIQLV